MSHHQTNTSSLNQGRQLTETFIDVYFMNYIEALAATSGQDEQPYLESPVFTDFEKTLPLLSSDLPSLKSFIHTLKVTFQLPRVILIAASVYLGRWRHRHPATPGLYPCAAHRLVLTSVILAAKHLYDHPPRNTDWLRILKERHIHHFSLDLLNSMEMEMLLDIGWNIAIYPADVLRVAEPVLFILEEDLRNFALEC